MDQVSGLQGTTSLGDTARNHVNWIMTTVDLAILQGFRKRAAAFSPGDQGGFLEEVGFKVGDGGWI